MLLWLSAGAGASGQSPTVAAFLAQVYPALGAAGSGDLLYWTDAQLQTWANEGLRRLAKTGSIIERDVTTTVAAGTHTYAVPTRHIGTIHASLVS